jgi:hypothetical protein
MVCHVRIRIVVFAEFFFVKIIKKGAKKKKKQDRNNAKTVFKHTQNRGKRGKRMGGNM